MQFLTFKVQYCNPSRSDCRPQIYEQKLVDWGSANSRLGLFGLLGLIGLQKLTFEVNYCKNWVSKVNFWVSGNPSNPSKPSRPQIPVSNKVFMPILCLGGRSKMVFQKATSYVRRVFEDVQTTLSRISPFKHPPLPSHLDSPDPRSRCEKPTDPLTQFFAI